MNVKLFGIIMTLFFGLSLYSQGQVTGNLMIISSEDAILYIDGEEKDKVEKDKPFKLSLETGEHLVQLISESDYDEKKETIVIEASALKVLKINFNDEIITEVGSKNVADLDLVIPGMINGDNKKDIYYAFESGDEIKVNVTMSNKNGTNSLKIKSHPEGIIAYQNLSFQELNDASVKISKRGIYKFELATQHSFDRNIHLNISRKPASEETVEFNTNVYEKWTYEPVSIIKPSEFTINGGFNAKVQGGKSRIIIPLQFPPNTTQWYIEYSAWRNPEEIMKVRENYSLFSGILGLMGPEGKVINFAVESLSQPPGSDICDLYLLNNQNVQPFLDKLEFSSIGAGTRLNFKSGIIEVKCCTDQEYYLGILNPASLDGIEVLVEVVAIVQKKELMMQE
ncbi:MAG: hypothetical protein RH860_09120 [Cytophagales bacterium]